MTPDQPLQLYNTLSGQLEPLTPADGQTLRMYACGPTVYDFGHIGNFRTFIHVDVLRRTLKLLGMNIRHVMNITDVDDKIIRGAALANQPLNAFTHKFEAAFLEDMDALSVERPEVLPRATEHIPEMVALIEELRARNIAYQAEDGSWYFRIDRFPDYGKLSKKDLEGIEDGIRVDVSEDKDGARDFALWKAVKGDEPSWPTPLGPGRPGWHIECSAMATRFLGPDFDLHAGGEDLMFPHHENEIAQSEAASGHTFARHWMHVRFLLVEGRKMSKSLGNFYTLRDLLLKGYRASAIRYLLMSVPYGHQLNFTWDGLTESTNAVDRLRTFAARMAGSFPEGAPDPALTEATAKASSDYLAALLNDLNTAQGPRRPSSISSAPPTPPPTPARSPPQTPARSSTSSPASTPSSRCSTIKTPTSPAPRSNGPNAKAASTRPTPRSPPSSPSPTRPSTSSSPNAPRPSAPATSPVPTPSATTSSKRASSSRTAKTESAGNANNPAVTTQSEPQHTGCPSSRS